MREQPQVVVQTIEGTKEAIVPMTLIDRVIIATRVKPLRSRAAEEQRAAEHMRCTYHCRICGRYSDEANMCENQLLANMSPKL